mgnify:FL=1
MRRAFDQNQLVQYPVVVRPIELKSVLTIFTKHSMGKLALFTACTELLGHEDFYSSAVSPEGEGYGSCLRGGLFSFPYGTNGSDGPGGMTESLRVCLPAL